MIPNRVEVLCLNCFAFCHSLESISFDSPSSLKRIESSAFAHSSLRLILIPNRVEILCSRCFAFCQSLESISFDSPSSLKCIESSVFESSSLRSVVVPPSVEFVDPSAWHGVIFLSLALTVPFHFTYGLSLPRIADA
jgi:hypothetical protein